MTKSSPLTVTITGPRGDEWERICGTRTFPVTTWVPIRANLPGKPDAEIWMLNLALIEASILDRIISHLATKFSLPVEEVRADVTEDGIPVLAEGAYVVLNDPQRWI